jgi:hypothetical protein
MTGRRLPRHDRGRALSSTPLSRPSPCHRRSQRGAAAFARRSSTVIAQLSCSAIQRDTPASTPRLKADEVSITMTTSRLPASPCFADVRPCNDMITLLIKGVDPRMSPTVVRPPRGVHDRNPRPHDGNRPRLGGTRRPGEPQLTLQAKTRRPTWHRDDTIDGITNGRPSVAATPASRRPRARSQPEQSRPARARPQD